MTKKPESSESSERRKHDRIEKLYNITYKVISQDSIFDRTLKSSGHSIDISLGGLKAIDDSKIDLKSKTLMEISINNGEAPIRVIGEVKWVKESEEGTTFGIEFVVVRETEAIENLVRH